MSESHTTGRNEPSIRQETSDTDRPTYRRFKESTDQKGRPKGSRNRKTIVREVANEMHAVTENGKPCMRSTLQLVLIKLRNMAVDSNNVGAFGEFDRLTQAYVPQAPSGKHGCLVVPAPMTDEEWLAAAEEANKTAEPPDGCFDP